MDAKYIKETIKLAKKGYGFVSPNPMVGAVIVKDGNVIGTGYHEFFGGPHAEVNAISSVVDKSQLVGSTIYVNLQPCSHTGKTPPCADLIVKSGITRVVYASLDTNSLVNDDKLISAGVEVVKGVLKSESDFLNRKFLKWKDTGKPYITLKVGSTLDGKMADLNGVSKWITSDSARKYVNKLRSGYDAILVGANTARLDDPNLGLHGVKARKEPLRMIISGSDLGSNLQIYRDDNFVQFKSFDEFWLYCKENAISSVFVEGGSQIFKYFIENRSFDELLVFYGPKLLGANHLNWASNTDILGLNESLNLDLVGCKRFDDTICATYLHK